MSVLTGLFAAMDYGLVFAFTRWAWPKADPGAVMPVFTFAVYPIMLLACGVIAAAVSRQIRMHVIAALAEAETRRKLDRVEHDLQIARTIQMALLPKRPPAVPGYDIAGWSQPADQTGGDYYDWMELPGGKILFTVADAAGHGIGPALLVAACRAYFRAIAMHDDPLDRITAQVDALLAPDVPPGRFITAVVALLEPGEHRLSLYSAGHAPLYFYSAADGAVQSFDADQPPLGVHAGDEGGKARVLPMRPGDALVLVTDGFFESMDGDGQLLGMEAFAERIRAHGALGAGEMIDRMHADVKAHANGQAQGDDLTAVVVKRAC
jgi:serine phosphatase RsbU (regulator of sigma subunit)